MRLCSVWSSNGYIINTSKPVIVFYTSLIIKFFNTCISEKKLSTTMCITDVLVFCWRCTSTTEQRASTEDISSYLILIKAYHNNTYNIVHTFLGLKDNINLLFHSWSENMYIIISKRIIFFIDAEFVASREVVVIRL